MGKTAFIFPGQGSQYVGMGKDFYEKFPAARDIFDKASEASGLDVAALCFEENEQIHITEYTQIAMLTVEVALLKVLEEMGYRPDAAAGLSLGEYAALAAADVMDVKDLFYCVRKRGIFMQEAVPTGGAMTAILGLDSETIAKACEETEGIVSVANYNCPGQLSCAGAVEELDAFVDAVKAAGGRAVKLAVSGAFHTPFMAETTQALAAKLETMQVNAPEITLYSNLTGEVYPSQKEQIIETVSKQASNSVRWENTIRNMAADGVDTFIEVGAGTTLSGLVKRTLTDVRVFNVCDMATLEETVKNI